MNNTISGNGDTGIYCWEYPFSIITNNTISRHRHCGIRDSSDSRPIIKNTIVWNNGKGIYIIPGNPGPIIRYSDIQGGWPGKGNIDADPLFVDGANDDFRLTFPSPCKDTGKNSHVGDPEDFEGDPRITNGTVDMGADEFYTHLYWMGDATPGGNVEIKLVGLPGTSPVFLWVGSGVLGAPIPTMFGYWHLDFPILLTLGLGSIVSPEGLSVLPYTFNHSFPAMDFPMQALIGAELTNLSVLEVR